MDISDETVSGPVTLSMPTEGFPREITCKSIQYIGIMNIFMVS